MKVRVETCVKMSSELNKIRKEQARCKTIEFHLVTELCVPHNWVMQIFLLNLPIIATTKVTWSDKESIKLWTREIHYSKIRINHSWILPSELASPVLLPEMENWIWAVWLARSLATHKWSQSETRLQVAVLISWLSSTCSIKVNSMIRLRW